ncbi:MAG: hypothetical protein EPO61_11335 [Nitrospirae bacterium]|nr:MAG: hypothetical protein EPO61_11335 [Nitrospirota bacterium]
MFSQITVDKGICYALFAYDVAWAIDLDEAGRHITESKERSTLRQKRRAPQSFKFYPPPLRVIQDADPLVIGNYRSLAAVDVVIYDFGAVSVTYTIPVDGPFAQLLAFSQELYDNPALQADARGRVERLLAAIIGAVKKPGILDAVEDYVIFQMTDWTAESAGNHLCPRHAQEIAQLLRGELLPLSDQEVEESVSCRIAYGVNDLAIIDWNAALVFGRGMEDVRAVLEFANVELLEARCLDQQLSEALDRDSDFLALPMTGRFRWPGSFEAEVQRIARFQIDSAVLFERVTNALKLLGDQYLARVYQLVSRRFHLSEWEASIIKKLQALESIYHKMSDRATIRRMEVLEWIIIVLIAVSILLSLLPGLSGH